MLLQQDATSRQELPSHPCWEVLTLPSPCSKSQGGTEGAPATGAECVAVLVSKGGSWGAEVETEELEAPEFEPGTLGPALPLYLFLVTECIQSALHKAFLDTMIKDQHSEGDTSVEETGFGEGAGSHRRA